MQENEYLRLSDEVLEQIEYLLDQSDGEIDYERNGVVLNVEFDDGAELVINKQAPMQEIWLASRLGAHHFQWQEGQWLDSKSQAELFELLLSVIKTLSGLDLQRP